MPLPLHLVVIVKMGKHQMELVIFCTPQDGQAALDNQINIEVGQGLTLQQMLNSYAPAAAGNDPLQYAVNVSSWTGIDPSLPLSEYDPSLLLSGATAGASLSDATTGISDTVASLLGGDFSSVGSGSGIDWAMVGLGLVAIYVVSRVI